MATGRDAEMRAAAWLATQVGLAELQASVGGCPQADPEALAVAQELLRDHLRRHASVAQALAAARDDCWVRLAPGPPRGTAAGLLLVALSQARRHGPLSFDAAMLGLFANA